MRLIGDIHGNWPYYETLVKGVDKSVQVGDFGIGFPPCNNQNKQERIDKRLKNTFSRGEHRFIRGNHDNPSVCKTYKEYISDGTIEVIEGKTIMYIGGALSIDGPSFVPNWRTEGKDWWPDEELSYNDLSVMVQVYEDIKPDVMITHECPESISNVLFSSFKNDGEAFYSRTRRAFDTMLSIHTPKLWVFGHWHKAKDTVLYDTRYICLDINQYIDMDFNDLYGGKAYY